MGQACNCDNRGPLQPEVVVEKKPRATPNNRPTPPTPNIVENNAIPDQQEPEEQRYEEDQADNECQKEEYASITVANNMYM